MIISSGRSQAWPVVLLTLVALVLAGAIAVVARSLPAAAAAGVEDEGADCPVSLPGSVPANCKPRPLHQAGRDAHLQHVRLAVLREEIKKLAEKYVYGEKPAKCERHRDGLQQQHHRQRVAERQERQFLGGRPAAERQRAFPAVIVLGGFGADTNTIRSSGAAVISYDPLAVGQEGRPAATSRARSTASTGRRAAPGCWPPGPGAPARSSTSSSSRAAASSRPIRSASRDAPATGRGLRDRRVRPAHRADHAHRVGQRRRPDLPRDRAGERRTAAEQRLLGAAVARRRVRLLHRQPERAARGHPRDGGHGRAARAVHHGEPAHRLAGRAVRQRVGARWGGGLQGARRGRQHHLLVGRPGRDALRHPVRMAGAAAGEHPEVPAALGRLDGRVPDREQQGRTCPSGGTGRPRPSPTARRPRRPRPRRRRPRRRLRPKAAARRQCRPTSGRAVSSPRFG